MDSEFAVREFIARDCNDLEERLNNLYRDGLELVQMREQDIETLNGRGIWVRAVLRRRRNLGTAYRSEC